MQGPDWFQQYTGAPRQSHQLELEGVRIHYDAWQGPPGAPALLFVHGNGAHSHWWDFIAPGFLDRWHVLAIDLSGAGDSDHRERYSAVTFANEIIGVARHAGHPNTVVVGHSFGGGMTRIAGYLHGDELAGVVLVDSGISANRGRRMPPSQPRDGIRYYDSLTEARRRFRLRPPQPCENTYILDYIAEHSVEQTERGWRYKLDQSLFSKMAADRNLDFPDAASLVQAISCPVGFIYGEQSRFFDSDSLAVVKSVIAPELLYSIPDAHHHLFLDQPLAFIDTLGQLLERLTATGRR